jgi:hypothetical protein
MFFMLRAAPAKIGQREVPHQLQRDGGQTLFPARKTEETARTEAASWRTAWKGERLLASVQQQEREEAVVRGMPCEQ